MNFGNINTQEIKDALSNVCVLPNGNTVTGADIATWAVYGWRKITSIDEPATGYRVGTYAVQEIDGLTCKLTVAIDVNLADEAAANAAALAAALVANIASQKTEAKELLDDGTQSIQRALRGFAELTLQEINTLRTKASLSNYTWTQFKNALKAKIDDQA
jgi:hypothetical protein